ncbi:MAG: hypothetical protein ACYC9S_00055 [Leptospirales bacterium]
MSQDTAKNSVHLTGHVVIRSLPSRRTSLYIEEQSPGHLSTETSTDASGMFSVSLPPGIYLLKALPSFACPIRNTLVLPPSTQTVRVTLTTFPLSFIHCNPSTLSVLGTPEPIVKRLNPPAISIQGIWIPSPSKPISIFATSALSSTTQEISVRPDGTFLWHPGSTGIFQIQAAPPGFCPLTGKVSIKNQSNYLEIRDSRFHPDSPCPIPLIRLHSRAFTPSG